MKRKLLLSLLGLLLGVAASAQNTLNVHQKDGSVVSFAFSEKPVVTYTDTGIHLVTTRVEVDYPMANLEKWTFSDDEAASIDVLRTDGTSDDIRIYNTAGVLVRTIPQSEGAVSFSPADLPAGIYIISNGKTTYKITKR